MGGGIERRWSGTAQFRLAEAQCRWDCDMNKSVGDGLRSGGGGGGVVVVCVCVCACACGREQVSQV